MGRTNKKGFTLIELLVVIAIIALLLSIIMPALGRAKEYAQRIMCANHLKQQSLGVMLYANEHDSYVMESPSGWWLWDVSFWTTEQMMLYSGFDDNKTFYCPANRLSTPEDARYWQFSWSPSSPNPVPIRDESVLTAAQRRSHYRVLPYVYMIEKIEVNPTTGVETFLLPRTLQDGSPARWVRRLSDVRNAGSTILIMDAVISQGNERQFFEIISGGISGVSQDTLTDNTNHRSRQRLGTGPGEIKPEGANIAYADGHVSWAQFGDRPPNSFMKHKTTHDATPPVWFWW